MLINIFSWNFRANIRITKCQVEFDNFSVVLKVFVNFRQSSFFSFFYHFLVILFNIYTALAVFGSSKPTFFALIRIFIL